MLINIYRLFIEIPLIQSSKCGLETMIVVLNKAKFDSIGQVVIILYKPSTQQSSLLRHGINVKLSPPCFMNISRALI